MTLYLKYRPQKIEELDLKEVRESFKNIIKSGNLPHAFLFAGPKGTGKTSAARIIAKVVNCTKNEIKLKEPCNRCKQCTSISEGSNIDIIELDAASHRGIDDIRALRDAVKLAPASARKKVYIIDEAHMLTTEASNALLKTLEEPPDHVFFILATTNPEKLIATIRSRTTLIKFNKAKQDEIVRSLKKIVKGEKVKIDNKTLFLVAKSSDGSFRDATKILEQIILEGVKTDHVSIEEFIDKKTSKTADLILDLVIGRKTQDALKEVEQVVDSGASVSLFVSEMIQKLRESLLAKEGIGEDALEKLEKDELIRLLSLLMDTERQIATSSIEQLPLELAIIKWDEVVSSRDKKGVENGDIEIEDEEIEVEKEEVEKKQKVEGKRVDKEKGINVISDELWSKILASMKNINYSIEALLRATRPMEFDGQTLTLGVFYKFHKERLEEVRNRQILEDVCASVLSKPTRIVCTLAKPPEVKIESAERKIQEDAILEDPQDDEIVKVAKDIFGS